MPATITAYPEFEEQVREFTQQHRKLRKDRLRLAVYFAPLRRAKRDIFVFEIIDGFGGDAPDPDKKLFEFAYGSTPGFPLEPDVSLRMILTSPGEFREAVQQKWKSLDELREAKRADRAMVIFADKVGTALWDMIQ